MLWKTRPRKSRGRRQGHHEPGAAGVRAALQAAFNSSFVDLAVLRGRDFVFEMVNPAYQAIAPEREFVGKTVADAWPELAGQVLPLLQNVVETGKPFHARDMRFDILRQGGASREEAYFSYDCQLLPSDDGDARVLVTAIETTPRVRALEELRRTEERLRESETRFRTLADSAPVSLWMTDPDGSMEFVNRSYREAFGATQARTGEWMPTVHPEDAPGYLEGFQEAVRDQKRFHAEGRYRRPDGAWRWIEAYGEPRFGAAREFLGLAGVTFDATEKKLSEERLRRSEERFRALIEKASDMIALLDRDAKLRFWSPSSTEVLGWAAEEVLGRSLFDYVHEDDRQAVLSVFSTALAKPGMTAGVSTRFRHKNGSWRLVEAVGRNLVEDPAVQGVVVNSRDVTDQRRLEEQYQQSQKLESIGRLAGGVAHDFNNMLTIILSYTEEMKAEIAAGKPVELEEVEAIHDAGRRAGGLTRQLLAFARRQVIRPVVLDLNALVRGCEKLLRRVLGEDIELRTNLQEDLWHVHCDPGQLDQVIMNLAVNGRDAMPNRGTLVIQTRNVVVDEARARGHSWLRIGSYASLVVKDSGMGMTAEVRANLFEPFFTTKPQGKGTGLGLATVYGIVKQSGGFILAESAPGEGATFEILLPRAEGEIAKAPSTPVVRATRGTETVLVVDDNAGVREVTARILKGAGYQVRVAATPSEGLEIADRDEYRPDLLVADVVLPEMSGRDLATKLSEGNRALRVLYISGHTDDVLSRVGVLDSDIEFLAKPFTAAALLSRVREVLDVPSQQG